MERIHLIPQLLGTPELPQPRLGGRLARVMILSQDRHLVARELGFPFLFLHIYIYLFDFKGEKNKMLTLVLVYTLRFLWS